MTRNEAMELVKLKYEGLVKDEPNDTFKLTYVKEDDDSFYIRGDIYENGEWADGQVEIVNKLTGDIEPDVIYK